jgi:hypothetical protein
VTEVQQLLMALSEHGFEKYSLFYGAYMATVVRNDDPEKRGRIQAVVPGALQKVAPDIWIAPIFTGAGANRGFFWPPEVGDSARVFFSRGNSSKPIAYLGGWYGVPSGTAESSEVPTELGYKAGETPVARGFVTRMGHVLAFSDEKDNETVDLVWHKADPGDKAVSDPTVTADRASGKLASVKFTKDGDIIITNQNNSSVYLDAKNKKIVITDENGNVATLDKDGVHIKATKQIDLVASKVMIADGADTPAVRGQDLLNWLTSHVHPTAWGPSGPPQQPPPQSILSQNVKLR